MPVFYLSDKIEFPPPYLATCEGLLAMGGDLCMERLLLAYRMGIFPWYGPHDPILWWSPDPRLVLYPSRLKVSRSLQKTIRKHRFHITMDTAFEKVITECAQSRLEKNEETWLVDEMIQAYCRLHEAGYAHSVEAWLEGTLAGGLYGVSLGKCFFGESMFTRISNASKTAFVTLVRYLENCSFDLIDCQVKTAHLMRLGAEEIPRLQFLAELHESLTRPSHTGKWVFPFSSAAQKRLKHA
jgi:leucyl/phenylalanyl-tRNA--protein transferase